METNNKIIAEFMGATLTKDLQIMYPVYEGDSSYVKDLKYHSDWNWLMQVVEKIERSKFVTEFEITKCNVFGVRVKIIPSLKNTFSWFGSGGKYKNKIEAVYFACVEFIKWYNENKD